MFQSSPDVNSLKDLTKETEDTDFWKNFKKGAPIVFCMAIEDDQNLKQERDLSFIEELMKTKNILKLLKTKVDEGAADIDIIEYASAVTLLEYKLQVLNALNISVDSDSDDKISFNIVGTSKSMVIDKAKLKEAITIMDSPVVETQGASSGSLTKDLPEISADLNDEEFLEEVKKVVGDIKKTPKKTLDKESFVKIFKYTGDYAKRKTRQVKAEGQAKRCQVFDDPDSKKIPPGYPRPHRVRRKSFRRHLAPGVRQTVHHAGVLRALAAGPHERPVRRHGAVQHGHPDGAPHLRPAGRADGSKDSRTGTRLEQLRIRTIQKRLH